jgi:hypothetical protein
VLFIGLVLEWVSIEWWMVPPRSNKTHKGKRGLTAYKNRQIMQMGEISNPTKRDHNDRHIQQWKIDKNQGRE